MYLLRDVFYLQGNLESRVAENQGATYSRATDEPVAVGGGATGDRSNMVGGEKTR
jgi:hypothetical protein